MQIRHNLLISLVVFSQIIEVAAELMNKTPQNPDAEVKKTLRAAYVKDSLPKYCNFLSKKVWTVISMI